MHMRLHVSVNRNVFVSMYVYVSVYRNMFVYQCVYSCIEYMYPGYEITRGATFSEESYPSLCRERYCGEYLTKT